MSANKKPKSAANELDEFLCEIEKEQTQTDIKQKLQQDRSNIILKPVNKDQMQEDNTKADLSGELKQEDNVQPMPEDINTTNKKIEEVKTTNELTGTLDIDKASSVDSSNLESEVGLKNTRENLSEDSKVLTQTVLNKQEHTSVLQGKIATLEKMLNQEISKLRTYESELKNISELAKSEKIALLKDKDDTILSLKHQIDKVVLDTENYKNQQKILQAKIITNDERIKKSVEALRTALRILEGTDE